MDDNLKAISLAAGTDAGGIAIAPDGVVWVTDKRDAPPGRAGQVFSILPDGSRWDAHPLPEVPDGRAGPQPAYVALQTSGNAVEAVWVSDNGAGVVYRLKPGTRDPKEVVVVDIGKDSRPRGLAWDQARHRVWVADEAGHRLLAIDPASNKPDPALTTSRPGSAIALVAVSAQGVWFTEFAPGKVSVLDADKKALTEFDVGLVTDDGTEKAIRYPYGLAVRGNSVWFTTNGIEGSPGELWAIDDTGNLETAKLRKVASFGADLSPRDIAVDSAGYFWISLFYGHKVVQITNAGTVVKEYDLDASALPGAIAYGSSQDEIWVSDETAANRRVVRLTPIKTVPFFKSASVRVDGDTLKAAGTVVGPTGEADPIDARRYVMRHIDVRCDRRKRTARRSVSCRLAILSAIISLPVSLLSGPAAALTANIKGDIEEHSDYRVYDGTLKLNGEITHPFPQERDDAFWIIFQPGGMPPPVDSGGGNLDDGSGAGIVLPDAKPADKPADYKGALPITATSNTALRRELSDEDIEKASLNGIIITRKQVENLSCIQQSPYYWYPGPLAPLLLPVIVPHLHDWVGVCDVPVTWMEWGQTKYWLDNPRFDLSVGPAETPVETTDDMKSNFPGAPNDIVWHEGQTYVIRLAATTKVAGDNDYAQRVIRYMGEPAVKDLSPQETEAESKGYAIISVAPENSQDYSLDRCKTTISGPGVDNATAHGGVDKAGDGHYRAILELQEANYQVGQTYTATTECFFSMINDASGRSWTVLGGQKSKAQLAHRIKILPEHQKTVVERVEVPKIVTQEVTREVTKVVTKETTKRVIPPKLTGIKGSFLDSTGEIAINASLFAIDSGADPKKTKVEYRSGGDKDWKTVPRITWDDGGLSFVATLPNTVLAPDVPVSLELRATAENGLTDEAHVPFALKSFVDLYFLRPDTEEPVTEGSGVKAQGEMLLRLKLVVRHPIGRLQSRLELPEHIEFDKKHRTFVQFSDGGERQRVPPHVLSVETDWDGSDKPFLFSTDLLKPGEYFITVPVAVEKSAGEDLRSVKWSVDAAKGDRYISPHEVSKVLPILP
ncbi:hypothetical protein [Nitratireductor thuwali]|uniref:Virginiamycin B lyase n=1 Tax=Nitratireductor thuwali TaxID=2267699 RepID=A0ABY5MFH0_9HYPH|nr:Virginiamycin B lyase [Nitratireductor thuwali]